jgi:hypothetical protein
MEKRTTLHPLGHVPSPSLHLKDALRGIRFGLRLGRDAIPGVHKDFPPPLRDLASGILSGIDQLEAQVESVTRKVARRFLNLGALTEGALSLTALRNASNGDELFAQAAYHALSRATVLQRGSSPLVSEVLAARAFRDVQARMSDDTPLAAFGAALLLEIQGADVVRYALQARAATDPQRRVALYGLIFWLLADRAADEDENALLAACFEVALALSDDLADAGDDPVRIEKLLAEYADCI